MGVGGNTRGGAQISGLGNWELGIGHSRTLLGLTHGWSETGFFCEILRYSRRFGQKPGLFDRSSSVLVFFSLLTSLLPSSTIPIV